ncbi:MG2 domain-containing protein [Nitrospina watsonii]|uniref:Alpha-2-macroglobulin domain protein n=1 Tax=Nitrospina watsonii TaxID=1323948 RepID=A0ABM9HB12_9BACT|nr:alpha-2-macroglobulin family protein [Nitrospina watsonii]CAI2717319.1 Alpha-2-macroglobulin domain protein [Nitrospina watsonii]
MPTPSRFFKNVSRLVLALCLLLIPSTPSFSNSSPELFQQLKNDAEQLYDRGSYSRAHKLYLDAKNLTLNDEDSRWVQFRLADTLWRAQSASNNPDTTAADKARFQLEKMVRDIKHPEFRDRIWAEVQESLGDFHWLRAQARNWGGGWRYYQRALDWWAGARDVELARQRYLGMIWKITQPSWIPPHYHYGYYGMNVPLPFLDNARKIARRDADRHHAQYLYAMALRRNGNIWHQQKISEAFEEALKAGRSSEWHDDALYHYAQWLAGSGEVIILADGQTVRKQNYKKALEYYTQLLREYGKGETRYHDDARRQIESITRPVLTLAAHSIFLPGTTPEVTLSWRNLSRIDLALYAIDLTRDVDLEDHRNPSQWLDTVNLLLKNGVQNWSEDTEDTGDHIPGSRTLQLKKSLPMGAYLLRATGGGHEVRELILVTDSALVTQTASKQALGYFCDSVSGAPIAGADVHFFEYYYNGNNWVWADAERKTNEQGLVVFDLQNRKNNSQYFMAAAHKGRQALVTGYNQTYHSGKHPWKIYVHTDRPAYRPEETVQWKLTARTYDGEVYNTPANATLNYILYDPRGTKLKEDTVKLNEFGSAWGELELPKTLPLGEYRIQFHSTGKNRRQIGQAALFRLEEYKLPEFKVAVHSPEENGKPKVFQLGDEVAVDIHAAYYFGGPVANANVEVVVYQRPYYHVWHRERTYPWYYRDMIAPPHRYWGSGQQVKREVLKTDVEGKARLTFETQRGGQDLEYQIEARVTDASRREVVAKGTVKVTRQPYYVQLKGEHNLYKPQDQITVGVKSLDANQRPHAATGMVKVTRDHWFEIWIAPDGSEVQGAELKALREQVSIFPPPPLPGQPGWRLKFRGYQHDDILTRSVTTSAEGEARVAFTPEREGYYRLQWTSQQHAQSVPIIAETTVWVADNATTELGYRHGGLEIIVDKDTFHAGETAPVMLVSHSSDRYVLFSVSADDLYSYQLVHLTGNVKLVELDVQEKHVPNMFLNGLMVSDNQIHRDVKQVVVPPVKQFLNVEVKADRDQYRPREEGTLTVTALDHKGRPVATEVALSLVDESVFYIQEDLAPDPRQFFYGTKRSNRLNMMSTFQMKAYRDRKREDQLRQSELERRSQEPGRFEGKGFSDQLGAASKMKANYAPAPGELMEESAPMSMDMAQVKTEGRVGNKELDKGDHTGMGESAVTVRSDFRTTVLWQPNVHTGNDGKATVKMTFPDSLTEWRTTARVVDRSNRFGIATGNARTQNPLIVRLQAPRFFVVGDEVTLSAVINNNTSEPLNVAPGIDAAGGLRLVKRLTHTQSAKGQLNLVAVPAHGEVRVDWLAVVEKPGDVKVQVLARTPKLSDAMEKRFVVHEHGIEKFLAKSGKVRGKSVSVTLDIPGERKIDSTKFSVQVSPSIAVTMLDALPYLIDFPYGCTEQTLSRFLPTVIVGKTLRDLGLDETAAMNRIFGGIDSKHTGETHPKGKQDLEKLQRMVQAGLDRLYDFQHGDGGWGWWKKGDSDPFMSAYVLWGLNLAREAGVEVRSDVLKRAYRFLNRALVEAETQYDMQAFLLHAAAHHGHTLKKQNRSNKFQAKAYQNLWHHKDRLNAYSRALLALAAHYLNHHDDAAVLVENLENGVQVDARPDQSIIQRGISGDNDAVMATAHWGEDGIYYRWSDGGVEATAFVLRALLTIDPGNKLIEPAMNWLVKNRRGAHWSNTRNTSIALLALTDYLKVSGELTGGQEYELIVNGRSIAKTRVEDVLQAPSRYTIDSGLVRSGANEILIQRSGDGPLYFAAHAEFFSLEEPITPAGNEIFVKRQYYKLVGRPSLLKGYVYDKQPLNDGDSVSSGDRIETVLTIEAKNHYEYLVFEDLKPAGFEAVQIRSGEDLHARELKWSALLEKFGGTETEPVAGKIGRFKQVALPPYLSSSDYTGRQRWVYQELRDRNVALFVDKLPQGVWEIRYTLRAEVPGHFHALPVLGHAMYIPEIRANGSETRIRVVDRVE